MKFISALILLSMVCLNVNAVPINVAEGANVTLNGLFGKLRSTEMFWTENPLAPDASVTDGLLRPTAEIWNADSVWWDAQEDTGASANNSIVIDLGGTYKIFGFSVQADDNDTYLLEYWDGAMWVAAWNIPAVGGFGMQTRPDLLDTDAIFVLGSKIMTDQLRFTATGGDDFYSVGEIRAYVPEPGTLALFGLGLAGLGFARRRKV